MTYVAPHNFLRKSRRQHLTEQAMHWASVLVVGIFTLAILHNQIQLTYADNTDTIAPTVSVTNPGNSAIVSHSLTLAANASDNVGVVSLQFLLDGSALGSPLTMGPYSMLWDSTTVTNGSHVFQATATDAAGNVGTSNPVYITVNNPVTNTSTSSTVTITAPAASTTLSGTVTLTANTTDNSPVTGVLFQADGATIGNLILSAPYTTTWNTIYATNGTHTLKAVAADASGNSFTSAPITVTVNNAAASSDTTPPTVSISAPTSNASVSGLVSISAAAADDVAVASVQFLVDGTNIGKPVINAPYTISWDSTPWPNGNHTLTAVATDTSKNTATSTPITVVVNNSLVSNPVQYYTPPTTPSMTTPPSVAAMPDDGTLAKDPGSPAVYIIENGQKHPFASVDALTGLGYNLSQVQTLDTSALPVGDPILSGQQQHPRGAVVVLSGTVYFIGAATKYPFPSAAVFQSWGHSFSEVVTGNSFDAALPTGDVVQMKQ